MRQPRLLGREEKIAAKAVGLAAGLDIKKLSGEYQSALPMYRKLEEEAKYILDRAIQKRNIKIHTILSRVKELRSLADKAERHKSLDPLREITDIVGLRVLCLFLSDMPRVGDVIRGSFSVKVEDDKIKNADASTFGYMSVHYVVGLPQACSGPRYDDIKDLTFEIQVRTLTMDAWAAVSHYLAYKDGASVPAHLQKDFQALSGLFYVADTHFELFFKESMRSKEAAVVALRKPNASLDVRIDRDSLAAYLRLRCRDRKHSSPVIVAELAAELVETGYDTLSKLDAALDAGWTQFMKSERLAHGKQYYTDVGVVRVLLTDTDKSYRALMDRKWQKGVRSSRPRRKHA